MTTVCQNFAFGHISVTSIVALGLLGQTCASLLVDRFGLLGMQRQPVRAGSWPGAMLALIGMAVMLDGTVAAAFAAACAAFGSGVSVVLSRTVNARLAEKTGALRGSLVNHLVGLPITVFLAVVTTGGVPPAATAGAETRPWSYLGGVLGVAVVLLCNLTVPKISAFRMTILGFVGQVFTGVLVDVLLGGESLGASFIGGLIIAAGVAVNLISDKLRAERERKRREYDARIKKIETEHRDAILQKHPVPDEWPVDAIRRFQRPINGDSSRVP